MKIFNRPPTAKNEKQYEKLKEKACRSPGPPALPTAPAPRAAVERNRGRALALSKVALPRRRRRRAPRGARRPRARNEPLRRHVWPRG
jgi:hypothetical protein